MKAVKITIGLFVGICSLLVMYIYISNTYVLPWEKKEAIKFTLEMGGLNELPKEIHDLKIDKKGSMFTRQFILEFECENLKQIENWMRKSKRLKNNTPTIENNRKIFKIYPGENGSNGGKVEIQGKKVKIDMSWS
ncbi:hypothetical protein [uncultured Tenacibaculum sp.]|uniref:hypothetical protein n=1 Tax=uncultured Tenacibaculum sp. TaxID=174713 RepID=UPI002610F76D|nr:hypothetical protein [uncultured Tenacibaculum sp.]